MHILTGLGLQNSSLKHADVMECLGHFNGIHVVPSIACNLTNQHVTWSEETSITEHICSEENTSLKPLEMPFPRRL